MPSLVPITPMPASILMMRRPREGEEGKEKRERSERDVEGRTEEVKVVVDPGGWRRRWILI